MGTETRIGIATGLLIVIVASVYFFYGSDRSEEDLPISIGSADSTPPRIPPAAGVRLPAPDATARRDTPDRSRTGPKPVRPASREKSARVDRSRHTRKAAVMPPRGKDEKLARVDPTRRSGATPPVARKLEEAGRPRIADPRPPAPSAERATQTNLRTRPSKGLIDATRQNLQSDPTGTAAAGSGTQTRTPSARTPSARNRETPTPRPADRSRPTAQPGRTTERAGRSSSPVRGAESGSRPADATRKPVSSKSIQRLPAVPSRPAGSWPKRHRVSFDETLSGISLRYYATSTKVDQILNANPRVRDPRLLKPGEVLLIPAPDQPGAASPSRAGQTQAEGRSSGQPSDRSSDQPSGRVYLVQRGDSFYSIARKMLGDATRWKELLERNRKLVKNDPKRLRPGMRITLPEAKKPPKRGNAE